MLKRLLLWLMRVNIRLVRYQVRTAKEEMKNKYKTELSQQISAYVEAGGNIHDLE